MLLKKTFCFALAMTLSAPAFTHLEAAQIAGGAAAVQSGSNSHKLTDKQKDELYVKGTITDSKGNVWNITTLPGMNKVKKIAKNGWVNAGHIVKGSLKKSKKTIFLLTKKTYYTKNLKNIVKDGIHGMKLGKDG
jgi:hypothetical protein